MSSKGSKAATPRSKSLMATGIGVAGWIIGFFMYFAIGPAVGLCAFLAVVSAFLLYQMLQVMKLAEGPDGNPMKTHCMVSVALFALQLVFFLALIVVGLEGMPWASRVFFTINAIYPICPVLVYFKAVKVEVGDK